MADSSEINPEASGLSVRDPDRSGPIWEHTRKPYQDEDQHYWDAKYKSFVTMRYCKYCDSHPTKAHRTTNFRNHLLNNHGITVEVTARKVTQDIENRASYLNKILGASDDLKQALSKSKRTPEEIAEELFRSYLMQNKKKIRRALVEFVVENRSPFHMVENSSLGTLLSCFNPCAKEVLPTSHNTVARYMVKSFDRQKELIQELLKSSYTRIHLSADIWTSPNNYLTLGLSGSFVRISDDGKPQRVRVLLGLQEVTGHSGENQCRLIAPILEEFDIMRKIGCIMGDNSGTNDTLCRFLSSRFESLETNPEWIAQEMRGRCLGHMINLIVNAFLANKEILEENEEEDLWVTITATSYEEAHDQAKEKGKKASRKKKTSSKLEPIAVLTKLHGIVVHMRNSPGHAKDFRRLAGRLIPQDNTTRWNSWFTMIKVACEKEAAIVKYTLNNRSDLSEKFLTNEDWKELRMVRDFLKVFHEATLRAEGENGSIGDTLVLLNALHECVTDEMVSNIRSSLALYANFIRREIIREPTECNGDCETVDQQLIIGGNVAFVSRLSTPTALFSNRNIVWSFSQPGGTYTVKKQLLKHGKEQQFLATV